MFCYKKALLNFSAFNQSPRTMLTLADAAADLGLQYFSIGIYTGLALKFICPYTFLN